MFDKKILVLGNETRDTDHQVQILADQDLGRNHGLLSDPHQDIQEPGYYHTTVVDLNEGQIEKLARSFDEILWLDQDQKTYPHYRTFVRTFRLIRSLEEKGMNTVYHLNKNAVRISFWWDFLRQNKSFCFQPFVALVPDTDYTNICPKSKIPIKPPQDIKDWRTDPDYRVLRDSMLQGQQMPGYCQDCYHKESKGVESARQFETLEWAMRLEFDDPWEFDQITDPLMYEIRPSNKCNIMCRTCDDARSHLIERENIKLNIPLIPWRFRDLPFEQINLDKALRIYVGGGEPTIMPEFYAFLQKCVEAQHTDFELCIGTNGMKISKKLIDLLEHFSDVVFSFSFDGYSRVNDYIRWRSDFETVRRNAHLVQSLGHKIGMQTVPSMYNATRLHEVFEFYDREFPGCSSLVQAATGRDDILLPWNHPDRDMVLASLERCRGTDQYLMSGRSLKSYVDSMFDIYSDPDYRCDLNMLKKFFDYNDMLDKSRGSHLGDYIPELQQARIRLGL